jgi:hypothetical protein
VPSRALVTCRLPAGSGPWSNHPSPQSGAAPGGGQS